MSYLLEAKLVGDRAVVTGEVKKDLVPVRPLVVVDRRTTQQCLIAVVAMIAFASVLAACNSSSDAPAPVIGETPIQKDIAPNQSLIVQCDYVGYVITPATQTSEGLITDDKGYRIPIIGDRCALRGENLTCHPLEDPAYYDKGVAVEMKRTTTTIQEIVLGSVVNKKVIQFATTVFYYKSQGCREVPYLENMPKDGKKGAQPTFTPLDDAIRRQREKPTAIPQQAAPKQPTDRCLYTAKSGDTWSGIADQSGMSMGEFMKLNGLSTDTVTKTRPNANTEYKVCQQQNRRPGPVDPNVLFRRYSQERREVADISFRQTGFRANSYRANYR